MGFLLGLIYFVIAIVSLLLVGLVLVQDSKAGGLSAAIAGSGDSFVGAAANKGITKVTAWLAGFFILLCLVAGVMSQKDKRGSIMGDEDAGATEISAPTDGVIDGGPTDGAGTGSTGTGSTDGATGTPPTGDGN